MAGKVLLNSRAPCDPPKTSRCGASPVAGGSLKNSGRTGMPVTSALRKKIAAAGKFTAAACTCFPTSRFARPGMAFGSKAMVGTRSISAAAIPGPEA